MEYGVFDDGGNQPSTSAMLPAQPQNGQIRLYDNPARKFTRPYSAKTVVFYKEGDDYFAGIRVAVSDHRYKTLHSLMDDLNRIMWLPFGVRKITPLMGNEIITNVNQLQHGGKYLASSSNPPKGVNLDRIHQFSASLRQNQQSNSSNGGASFMTPTSSPFRFAASRYHFTRQLNRLIQSSKLVFFVLNGKGKFYRALINPAKMPTLDMILEDCSTHLEVAIHRLYTPEGKLVTKVEDIMDYNGIRIIACPRNERPHFDDRNAETLLPSISSINPNRYAPRKPVSKITDSGVVATSSNSAESNGIEKRERLPQISNRYIPRKQRSNENSTGNGPSSYIPRTFASQQQKSIAKSVVSQNSINNSVKTTKIPTKSPKIVRKVVEKKGKEEVTSAGSLKRDSGNGNSITSSRQSERAETMTDRKAQMIRDELRANLAQNNQSSDNYSEEDRILEEDSDYDHAVDPIESGTSDEESDNDSALGSNSNSKPSPIQRALSSKLSTASHRTPARRTPSTESEEEEKVARRSSKTNAMSHYTPVDSPYVGTPSSRPSTNQSNSATRPVSSGEFEYVPAEESDDDGHEDVANPDDKLFSPSSSSDSEEVEDDVDTPAAHTPDTRASSVMSSGSGKSTWSPVENKKALTPPPTPPPIVVVPMTEEEQQNHAAVTIQKSFRGYLVRRKRVRIITTYTVEIMLGSRFGLDFDTPLYVVVYGDWGQSKKIWTETVDWIFTGDDHYQNEGWIVVKFRCKNLGILQSLIVGHEKQGYGAGTFINRIVISEDLMEGRRFLFNVGKWLDSGQMDGLIERKVYPISYCHHPPQRALDSDRTQNRWEFRLHTKEGEMGGTTSNLNVIGYGDTDSNANFIENDSLLRDPTAISVIQLDFGDIGELRKVRFEIDGTGNHPFYYLAYVEAQNMDTMERCVMMVENWLSTDKMPGIKRWQPFREVALFVPKMLPAPVVTYEGKVHFGDTSLLLGSEAPIYLQFYSYRLGINANEVYTDSSGIFPIIQTKTRSKDGTLNTHFSYQVDLVSIGETPQIRVIPQMTKLGKDVIESIHLMNEVYSPMIKRDANSNVDKLPMAEGIFIKEIHQKHGDHMPYKSIYTTSVVSYEQNNGKGPYFIHLKPKEAIAVSTRRKYKKQEGEEIVTAQTATWQLTMSLVYYVATEPIIPRVVIVDKNRKIYDMECLMEEPERHESHLLLTYMCENENFGNPEKLRVSCEDFGPDNRTSIHKMKLRELNTGTEVFFKPRPLVYDQDNKLVEAEEMELNEYSTLEAECFYPDEGTDSHDDFEIHIRTVETGGGDFRPYINLIGEKGDTGYRAFPGNPKAFMSKEVVDMNISSLSLQLLQRIEVWAKDGNPINWKGTIKVVQYRKRTVEFEYKTDVLELTGNGKIAIADLTFVGEVARVVEGESYI